MTFDDLWNAGTIDTFYKVRNGTPPPSANFEGTPYLAWKSHNFVGTLEEKIERNGWRYLRFEVLNSDTPDSVTYLAYDIADLGGHTFEVQP